MAFLDNSGLSKLWAKIKEQLNSKANASHDHTSISGTASNITGVVDFAHGGTGRTNRDSGYSALMSGGTYTGNLNDCLNCGHYLISTSNANCPLQNETYGWMHVYTKERDSANVLQEVTGISTQTKWVRTHTAGVWTDWEEFRTVSELWKQESKPIPSGADLNTYLQNGIYVSTSSSNQIKNLPLYFGSEGAFTLVVTGITNTTAYTTQILYSISDQPYIYMYEINITGKHRGNGRTGLGYQLKNRAHIYLLLI